MSRTRIGRDFISNALFGRPRPNPAVVIALSAVAYTPPEQGFNNNTTMNGTLTAELAADGLGRAVALYVHTAGAQTSTLQKTFTHTAPAGANPHTIYAVAVFSPEVDGVAGAANSGVMVFETSEPNPPTLTGTDSLNQTVSIDFGS